MFDVLQAYHKALDNQKEGKLHVVHVGIYEDKTIIVLHTDKDTKEVTVVDTTVKPEEEIQALPSDPRDQGEVVQPPKKEKAGKLQRDPLACQYCGKVCQSKSGKTRHEKTCPQRK